MALAGSSPSLSCSTDSIPDVCWEFYPRHSSIPRTIYAGRRVNRQYTTSHRVAVDGHHVTLTVLNAQLGDAGMYQCRECAAVHSVDVELIVLGK